VTFFIIIIGICSLLFLDKTGSVPLQQSTAVRVLKLSAVFDAVDHELFLKHLECSWALESFET